MGQSRRLRRLRRFVPYPLIAAMLLWLQPQMLSGSQRADQLLDLAGLAVMLAGQALRFWTWAANAREGLFEVRTHGPYALMRHPIYAGNLLILTGALMILHNPVLYAVGIPAFVLLYAVIARKEEQQLLASPRLGPHYRAYAASQPNRFLPNLGRVRLALTPANGFDWWFAAEKEYETTFGILLGWIALDFYEEWFVWRGASHGGAVLAVELAFLGLIAVAAPALYYQKKVYRRRPMPPAPAASMPQEPELAAGPSKPAR